MTLKIIILSLKKNDRNNDCRIFEVILVRNLTKI